MSECILKAQVPGVSMRPPLSTDADDLLHCSAIVANLGERGEPECHHCVRECKLWAAGMSSLSKGMQVMGCWYVIIG